jgi:hypothetical protein
VYDCAAIIECMAASSGLLTSHLKLHSSQLSRCSDWSALLTRGRLRFVHITHHWPCDDSCCIMLLQAKQTQHELGLTTNQVIDLRAINTAVTNNLTEALGHNKKLKEEIVALNYRLEQV